MLAASLGFATMAVFIKFGAQNFSTAELVFYRSALSGVAMYAVMRRRGISLATKHAGMHVRRALFSVVGFVMFFHAMAELPLATAMALNYTAPFFTVALLLWLARERPDAIVAVAVVLGFSATLVS